MDRFGPASIAIAVAVLAIIVMYVSWRRRSKRDAAYLPLHEVPSELGTPLADAAGFYVATTVHDKPFERMAVPGLGFRGRVAVEVSTGGVVFQIPGEPVVFVPAASVIAAETATWAIDRVVERDGLVLLAWSVARPTADGQAGEAGPGLTIIDSYFRIVEDDARVALIAAMRQIAPARNSVRDQAASEGRP